MTRLILPALVGAGLVTCVCAQGMTGQLGGLPLPVPDVREIPWPDVAGYDVGEAFHELKPAYIRGADMVDFVVQRGEHLYTQAAPNIWNAHVPIGRMVSDVYQELVVNDFDILPGYGPNGEDAVVCSAAANDPQGGMVLAWFDYSLDYFTGQFVPKNSFRECKHVVVADFTGDGLDDVAMVNATGKRLEVLKQEPGQVWVPHSLYLLPHEAIDIQALQWDASTPEYELAVIDEDGLFIREHDGNPLYDLRSIVSNDSIAIFNDGGGEEGVVYSTGDPLDPNKEVFLIVHTSGTWSSLVRLDNDVAGLDAADLDGDGDDDVVFSFTNTSDLYVFENHEIDPPTTQAPTQLFSHDPGAYEVVALEDVPVSNPGSDMAPLLVDLDNDSLPCAVIPIAPEETTYLTRDELLPPFELPSSIADLDFGVGDCHVYTWGGPSAVLRLEILNSFNPLYQDVEVILWQQGVDGASTNPQGVYTDPDAVAHCFYNLPLPSHGPSGAECYYLEIQIPDAAMSPSQAEFTQIYYAEVFLMDKTGVNPPGRVAVGSFSMDEDAILQVKEFEDWVPYIFESDVEEGSGAQSGGVDGNPLGGFVRGKRVPRFPPGSMPRPGNECPGGHGDITP